MLLVSLLLCVLRCVCACCAECVSGCECEELTQTVRCVSASLSDVPNTLPRNTLRLIMRGNSIPRIQRNSFIRTENITTLELTNNGITELGSHAFSVLRMLSRLDLSENCLALIHPEAFSISGSPLQRLVLTSSLFNSSSVSDLVTALRWGALWSLRELDLSENPLVLLPPGVFSSLSGLRRLLLVNSSLTTICSGTLSGLERLLELDLRFNGLQTLASDALREFERLGQVRLLLGQNPYRCSCEALELSLWINTSRVSDAEDLRCSSPPGLQGVPVRMLGSTAARCLGESHADMTHVALPTSYVLLGLVLGLVGMVFLLVVYLNRGGIERWLTELYAACRDVLDGYHYRYELDSDPRLRNLTNQSQHQNQSRRTEHRTQRTHIPQDTRITHVPADVKV
ncbi:trophoblast glycoprotein-like [Hoplias malabaricus]|uniref:trophoblast glycoprotein-like n=1 Tax=Hoplias malabaricus TaxID=27720 RepID=UPI0034625652